MNRERKPTVAAFFDLDGTLLPLPSLEARFFRALRRSHAIPCKNYLLWLREALRLLPLGINGVLYSNKSYLNGIRDFCGEAKLDQQARSCLAFSCRTEMNPSVNRKPLFFREAIDRLAWHAGQGHAIVLVSGTLQTLAREAAIALGLQLAFRRISAPLAFLATQLEANQGAWTGRIVGEAMFGEEKVRAMRRFASERGLDLKCSFAYGDSIHDRWMLEAVGKPAAVNPSDDLARVARRNGWEILRWEHGQASRHSSLHARVALPRNGETAEMQKEWQT